MNRLRGAKARQLHVGSLLGATESSQDATNPHSTTVTHTHTHAHVGPDAQGADTDDTSDSSPVDQALLQASRASTMHTARQTLAYRAARHSLGSSPPRASSYTHTHTHAPTHTQYHGSETDTHSHSAAAAAHNDALATRHEAAGYRRHSLDWQRLHREGGPREPLVATVDAASPLAAVADGLAHAQAHIQARDRGTGWPAPAGRRGSHVSSGRASPRAAGGETEEPSAVAVAGLASTVATMQLQHGAAMAEITAAHARELASAQEMALSRLTQAREAQAQVVELTARCVALEQQCVSLSEQLRRRETDAARELQAALTTALERETAADERARQSAGRVGELEARVQAAESSTNKMAAELAQLHDSSLAQLREFQDAMRMAKDEIEALEREKQQLTGQAAEANTSAQMLQAAEQLIAELTQRCDMLSVELGNVTQRAIDAEAGRVELEHEIASLRTKLAATTELQGEEVGRSALPPTSDELQRFEGEVSRLHEALQSAEAARAAAEGAAADAAEQNAAAQGLVAELRSRNETVEAELGQIKGEVADLREQAAASQAELRRVQQQFEQERSHHAQTRSQLHQVAASTDTLRRACEELELAAATRLQECQRDHIDALQQARDDLVFERTRNEELQQRIRELEANPRRPRTDSDALAGNDSGDAVVRDMRSSYMTRLQALDKQLADQSEQHAREIAALRAAASSAQDQARRDANERMATLERQLSQVQSEKAAAREAVISELHVVREQLNTLATEATRLATENASLTAQLSESDARQQATPQQRSGGPTTEEGPLEPQRNWAGEIKLLEDAVYHQKRRAERAEVRLEQLEPVLEALPAVQDRLEALDAALETRTTDNKHTTAELLRQLEDARGEALAAVSERDSAVARAVEAEERLRMQESVHERMLQSVAGDVAALQADMVRVAAASSSAPSVGHTASLGDSGPERPAQPVDSTHFVEALHEVTHWHRRADAAMRAVDVIWPVLVAVDQALLGGATGPSGVHSPRLPTIVEPSSLPATLGDDPVHWVVDRDRLHQIREAAVGVSRRMRDLEHRLLSTAAAASKLSAQANVNEADRRRLVLQLAERDEDVHRLTTSVDALHARIEALDADLQQARAEAGVSRQHLVGNKRELKEARRALQASEAEAARLRVRLENLQHQSAATQSAMRKKILSLMQSVLSRGATVESQRIEEGVDERRNGEQPPEGQLLCESGTSSAFITSEALDAAMLRTSLAVERTVNTSFASSEVDSKPPPQSVDASRTRPAPASPTLNARRSRSSTSDVDAVPRSRRMMPPVRAHAPELLDASSISEPPIDLVSPPATPIAPHPSPPALDAAPQLESRRPSIVESASDASNMAESIAPAVSHEAMPAAGNAQHLKHALPPNASVRPPPPRAPSARGKVEVSAPDAGVAPDNARANANAVVSIREAVPTAPTADPVPPTVPLSFAERLRRASSSSVVASLHKGAMRGAEHPSPKPAFSLEGSATPELTGNTLSSMEQDPNAPDSGTAPPRFEDGTILAEKPAAESTVASEEVALPLQAPAAATSKGESDALAATPLPVRAPPPRGRPLQRDASHRVPMSRPAAEAAADKYKERVAEMQSGDPRTSFSRFYMQAAASAGLVPSAPSSRASSRASTGSPAPSPSRSPPPHLRGISAALPPHVSWRVGVAQEEAVAHAGDASDEAFDGDMSADMTTNVLGATGSASQPPRPVPPRVPPHLRGRGASFGQDSTQSFGQ